jgi:lipid-binding SYLF domain-containing protein
MRSNSLKQLGTFLLLTIFIHLLGIQPAFADTAAEIDQQVDAALKMLHSEIPKAKELSKAANGILVFPDVLKAGLIVGGQYGEGALRVKGKTVGYYNTIALEYLQKSAGWEIGTGPSVVVVDEGMAGSLTTTSAKDDIYAFFFDQGGLMIGLGLQGTKITKIKPD